MEKNSLSGAVLLIIDNEDADIDIVQIVCRHLNIKTLAFKSVEDARSAIQQGLSEQPDLILLDLDLKQSSGYDFFRELRQHFAQTPIVAYSTLIEELSQVQQAGFDGFLGKPIRVTEFPAQLEDVLVRKKSVWSRGGA